jgi:hypothetical protein
MKNQKLVSLSAQKAVWSCAQTLSQSRKVRLP